jgi:hypothetical protein
LAPLAAAILWIGLWPEFFLARMRPTLQMITARVQPAVERLDEPNVAERASWQRDTSEEPTRAR